MHARVHQLSVGNSHCRGFVIFSVVIFICIITIIVTRTRPAFGRQGLVRIVGMVTSPGRSLFQTHKTDIRQTLGQTLRPLTTLDKHRQTLTSNPTPHIALSFQNYSFGQTSNRTDLGRVDLKQDRRR